MWTKLDIISYISTIFVERGSSLLSRYLSRIHGIIRLIMNILVTKGRLFGLMNLWNLGIEDLKMYFPALRDSLIPDSMTNLHIFFTASVSLGGSLVVN